MCWHCCNNDIDGADILFPDAFWKTARLVMSYAVFFVFLKYEIFNKMRNITLPFIVKMMYDFSIKTI